MTRCTELPYLQALRVKDIRFKTYSTKVLSSFSFRPRAKRVIIKRKNTGVGI